MLSDFEPAPPMVKDAPARQVKLSAVNFTSIRWSVLIFLAGLSVDLLSKYLVAQAGLNNILIPGLLSLTDHQNHGLIGNLPLPKYLIIILTVLALVLVGKAWLVAVRQRDGLGKAGLAFILAGALGNLADRLVHGYVYDWILLFNTSIINLADVMITLGIIIYIYSQINNGQTTKINK